MYQKFTSLLTLFDTGSLGQRRFDLASKRCAYAPYQAKLEGVCVVATPDPIDKLTVTWKVPTSGAAGQGFGVALKTEYMGQVGRTNYREEEEYGVLDCQLTFGRSTSSEFPKLITFPA